MYSFCYLEPVCCSMSSSNCCFLTCIQVSQEAGQESNYRLNLLQLLVLFLTYKKAKRRRRERRREERERKITKRISLLLVQVCGVFCVFFPTIRQVSGVCKTVALGVEAQKNVDVGSQLQKNSFHLNN